MSALVQKISPALAATGIAVQTAEFADVPDTMKAAKRWLVWHSPATQPDEKPRKVPYYVTGVRRTGKLDTAEDIARFGTFTDACAALATGRYTGLGFALGPDGTGNYWQGIDLDHVDQNPALATLAEDLPGYTERSVSGNGWHAIGYGKPFATLGSNRSGVEAYAERRYFTVTGDCAGLHPPCDIADFVAERIAPIHARKPPSDSPGPVDAASSSPSTARVSPEVVADLRSALSALNADDRDTWIAVGSALRELGAVGQSLWWDWSQTSEKCQPADKRTWATLAHERTGYQAVFAKAQAAGWVNPAATTTTIAPAHVCRPPPNWKLQPIQELLGQLAPTRWLVRGLFEKGTSACIFGASGSGKSFVAVDLTCSIATDTPWHGHRISKGLVVYLCGEGHVGIRKRFLAWSIEHKVSLDEAPILLSSAAIDVSANGQAIIDTIKAVCGGWLPVLVVVDTLHRHLRPGANENSGEDIAPMLGALDGVAREFDCATILIHHTGHTAAERERGWSGIRASIDWSYSVSKGDKGPLTFTCRKAKDQEMGEPIQFALHSVELPWKDEEGEPETSAALRSTGNTVSGMGGNQMLALTCLRKLLHAAKGEPVMVNDWRKATKLDRKRWPEVLAKLQSTGAVIIEGDCVCLP